MPPDHPRRALLLGGWTLALGLAAPRVRACEFITNNLRVLHPFTHAVRPGPDGALVSLRIDQVLDDDRLLAVETPVAGRVLMGPAPGASAPAVRLPRGRETVFSETGAQLRLLDLTQPLEATCAYPLRLLFARSEPVEAQLSIDFGPRFS